MEIRITMQQVPGVMLAPVSTVFPHGKGHAVFVVDAGRARLQPVVLLGRNGQQAWLQTRLPTGTVLVAYPDATLREGDRVKPLTP
jgi:HlyD family secretion protein